MQAVGYKKQCRENRIKQWPQADEWEIKPSDKLSLVTERGPNK